MLIPAVQNVPSVLSVLMVHPVVLILQQRVQLEHMPVVQHRVLLVVQGNTMTLLVVSMYVRTVLLDLQRLERVVPLKEVPVQVQILKHVSHVLLAKRVLRRVIGNVVLVLPVEPVLVALPRTPILAPTVLLGKHLSLQDLESTAKRVLLLAVPTV